MNTWKLEFVILTNLYSSFWSSRTTILEYLDIIIML